MKKLICLSVFNVLLVLGLGAQAVVAAPILAANFCSVAVPDVDHSSCPVGLTQASLEFTENTATRDDLNDYFLLVTFAGNASAPAYLDEFDFTIDGVKTPDGYEVKPFITAFSGGNGWQTFYDKIAANDASCTVDGGQGAEESAHRADPAIPSTLVRR